MFCSLLTLQISRIALIVQYQSVWSDRRDEVHRIGSEFLGESSCRQHRQRYLPKLAILLYKPHTTVQSNQPSRLMSSRRLRGPDIPESKPFTCRHRISQRDLHAYCILHDMRSLFCWNVLLFYQRNHRHKASELSLCDNCHTPRCSSHPRYRVNKIDVQRRGRPYLHASISISDAYVVDYSSVSVSSRLLSTPVSTSVLPHHKIIPCVNGSSSSGPNKLRSPKVGSLALPIPRSYYRCLNAYCTVPEDLDLEVSRS